MKHAIGYKWRIVHLWVNSMHPILFILIQALKWLGMLKRLGLRFLSDYLLVVMSLVINLISLNIGIFIFERKESYAKFVAVICRKKVCEYTEKWMSVGKK